MKYRKILGKMPYCLNHKKKRKVIIDYNVVFCVEIVYIDSINIMRNSHYI